MLLFLYNFSEHFSALNIFKYLTVRSGGAALTALLICLLLGPWFIRKIRKLQPHGQPIREDGPKQHFEKIGTPTMGGIIIIFGVLFATLLWANILSHYIITVIFVMLGFATIGFIDDYIKITKSSVNGLTIRSRIIAEYAVALIACIYISFESQHFSIALPVFKNLQIPFGYAYPIVSASIIVFTANAVNFTDGLDGLAIVPTVIAITCFGIIAYLVGNVIFANYLLIKYVPGTGELSVLCAAIVGAGLGFLWYNAPPAWVFMGDTGSLSLGATIATIAIITHQEFTLAIIGGLFYIEAFSTIIQITNYKLTGRRIFKMAPIHHHYEKHGWSEAQIVIRFWIIAVILGVLGLISLKLR